MKQPLVVILLAVVTVTVGCASAAPRPTRVSAPPPNATPAEVALTDSAKQKFNAYIDCAVERADRYVNGTASASEIADAALADCGREYDSMRLATGDFFASGVSRQGKYQATLQGYAKAAAVRDETRGVLISRVLRAREP
jgi:hypothetical protein